VILTKLHAVGKDGGLGGVMGRLKGVSLVLHATELAFKIVFPVFKNERVLALVKVPMERKVVE